MCSSDLVALPGYGPGPRLPEELPEQSVLCAWSLGGLLALEWARQRPDKVAGLVLVGSTPRFVAADDWPHAQPSGLLETFASAVAADPAVALRRFAALVNQGDTQARKVTRQLNALLDDGVPAAETLAEGLRQLAGKDLRAAVPELRLPVLVVHGEQDPLMPLAAGRWLAEHLPTAQLEVVPGAAHAPFLSHCADFCDRLTDFVHG